MFDLHIHTRASDGDLDAKAVMAEANKKGIKQLAITDHDTIENIKPCMNEGEKYGILVVPGIEITTQYEGARMHILGYGFDLKNKELHTTMKHIRDDLINRNLKVINILNQLNVNITYEDVIKCSDGNENVRRPHIAMAMVKKGYVDSVDDGFNKYLSIPEIAHLERYRLTPKDAIQLIKKAGGIAVLAHPCTLNLSYEDTYYKIKELKTYGLTGVEAYHSKHSPEQAQKYREMAKVENLVVTCGSDFHGKTVRPGVELGTGIDCNLPTDDKSIFDKFYRLIDDESMR